VTAFVLGATGFVGREVVRQLCVRGTKTIAHVRPDSRSLDDWRKRLVGIGAEVDTTVWDAAQLGQTFRVTAPTQVYILIGTTRAKAKTDQVDGDIYEKIDVGLTKIAVEAARGADPKARSPYLSARARAEEIVTSSGLPWVIARPSFITGEREESRFGERAAAVFGDGLLAVAGVVGGKKLRSKYRSTTPDILASALIRLGEATEHDRIVDGADLR